MDYEKAYKEALERASKLQENSNGMILKKLLWNIFPELKESEDERMLREIKRYIKEQGDKPTGLPNGTVAISDMIAWLEKQGEKKPADSYCQENCKGFKETGKCFADGDCKAKRDAEQNSLKIYAKQWRSKP